MPVSKDIPTPFLCAHKAASRPLILTEVWNTWALCPCPPLWVITLWYLLGISQCTDGDGNQPPRFLIKKKLGCGVGVGRTTLPIDEKNTLKSNRLRKTHFQVPNDIMQSIDNVGYSDPWQSVIENKIDIKCTRAHL